MKGVSTRKKEENGFCKIEGETERIENRERQTKGI